LASRVHMATEKLEDISSGFSKLKSIGDVNVEITAVLGVIKMPIEQFLKLGQGAIFMLNQHKDDQIEVRVNNHTVAYADVIVLNEYVGMELREFIGDEKQSSSDDDPMAAAMAGGDDPMAAAMAGMDGDDDPMAAAMAEMDGDDDPMAAAMAEMDS